MKLNFTDFLRKGQFPLLFALGLFPGLALILIATLPACWPVLWLYPVCYVLLAWLCLVLPGKIRLVVGLLGAAALMGLGVYLLPEKSLLGAVSLLTPVSYSVVLLAGLRISGWPRERELPFAVLAAGVVMHVLWQILVNLGTLFDFAAAPMFMCFLGYLVLAVLSMNRYSVSTAAMGRQKVSTVMRRQNLFLTLGLVALVLFLALVPAVIAAIEKTWDLLMALVDQVVMLLYKLMNPTGSESGTGGPGGASMDLSGLDQGEPSAFALIMEKVAMVIAVILGAILICFVVRTVYRKLKILFRYILKRLNEYAAHSTEDYEDEITDTREGGEKERVSLSRRLWQFDRVDEKKLTPAQRIRYRYQKLMRRHRDWAPGATARETLPPQAAEIYERVRYSDHPVNEKDADDFAAKIKQV